MNRSSLFAAAAAMLTVAFPSEAAVWRFDWAGAVDGLSSNVATTSIAIGDRAYASFRFDTASATQIASATGTTSYAVKLTDYFTAIQRYGVGNIVAWDVPAIDATLTLLDDQNGQDGYRFTVALAGPATVVDYQASGSSSAWTAPSLASDFRGPGLPNRQLSFLIGAAPTQERVLATVDATVDNLSTVPEPASWALLIVGFGAVGLMLRTVGARARARPDHRLS